MVESTPNLISGVSIVELKEETMTRGTLYKFALLNQSIIRSLWEIGHKFALKNPNQVRHITFERRFRGLLQDRISDIEDLKSQR